ncbi:kelch domain-containing 8A [Pelobates cultripes]|uniref:Kelch domain-containing 8A n=1 Tax=Pelobates cultripes TaxID=61616 RepID=A0AAD1QZT1_PELCU|nr:kelch domain-containing 8A [Pelobates cultripes]
MDRRSSLGHATVDRREENYKSVTQSQERMTADKNTMTYRTPTNTPNACLYKARSRQQSDADSPEIFDPMSQSLLGMSATRRKPIKGAAGRPIQFKYDDIATRARILEQAKSSTAKTGKERLVSVPLQIVLFALITLLAVLLYNVGGSSENPFMILFETTKETQPLKLEEERSAAPKTGDSQILMPAVQHPDELPLLRAGVSVVALGKRIMVVGGVGENQTPLKVVEVYNIDEGKWKKKSSLREPAMGISITARDCRVYAAGGMGSDLRPHCFLQQYDMLKDIWVYLAPMPTPRYGATSFLRGTKIYVLGGRQSKYAVSAFEVFDLETRSWTKFPSIPNKRAYSRYILSDGSLYSLGGLRQGGTYRRPKFTKTVDIFDIEQGGWMKTERSCFLKKRRADFVAGSINGRVVVAGGLGNQPTVLETAEIFHPVKNRWESINSMPTPRCACASIVLKNRLYAIGGVNQGPSTAVEMLSLVET